MAILLALCHLILILHPLGRYYSVLAVFIVAMFVAILPIFFIIVAIWYVEVPSVLIDIMPLLAFWVVFFTYFVIVIVILSVAALYFRLFWNNLTFPNGKVQCNFSAFQFAVKILTVNYLAIIFSLGLLYPWAKVRRARYLAEHIKIMRRPALARSHRRPRQKRRRIGRGTVHR